MNKRQVEDFAEKDILDGKSHQEIFNEIVTTSDFNIHDVANVVRRIPTLEKRKKYNSTHIVLVVLLGFTILNKIYILFDSIDLSIYITLLNVVLISMSVLILFGIHTFKSNAHLAAGALMAISSFMVSFRLFYNVDLLSCCDLIAASFGAFLGFYLNSKLTESYGLNKELQKTHPQQRENSLLFTDK